MQDNIVITGMGAVTPIGIGVDAYWQALLSGVCGVERISRFDPEALAVQIAAQVKDLEPLQGKKLPAQSDAFTQYALLAAREAIGSQLPVAGERMGIVMGTAMAGVATTAATQEALTNAVHKKVGPRFVPRILGNIAAAQIAIEYGIKGTSVTVSTACASGGDAVREAALLLRAGEADAVLAVGAESILCPLVLYSLANSMALSRKNQTPESACRPFDAQRSGFVIGEGGGALLLERESAARARRAPIFARLLGWGNSSDAYHVTRPDPSGDGAIRCMRMALERADLRPGDIGYINAHGTGTLEGDAAEAAALLALFPKSPAISSTKGLTGHMMGAGGITEAICCIQALRTGLLPHTHNLTEPEFPLDFILSAPRAQAIQYAMSNAFGFGGQNSSLIFSRAD